MIDLDDQSVLAAADPARALAVAEATPEQWREALARAQSLEIPAGEPPAAAVFCGMGGSGIAGDVLAMLAVERGAVPVTIVKGYTLPAHADPRTLVICASYSGNTEETLACFDEASARGCRIVVITTGGALAERADAAGIPRVSPVEGLQPRAALASLAVPTLLIAQRAGVLPDISADLSEAEEVLAGRAKSLAGSIPAMDNEGKVLAEQLFGKLPLVWGQEGPLAVAALRWRCQLNENAKVPAFSSVLPELDHNELVGYHESAPVLTDIALVVLRGPAEHPRVAKRIDVTLAEVRDRVGVVIEAWAVGRSSLAQLMSASLLGDFVSLYLAFIRGVDPTPVEVIQRLKASLG